MTDRNGKIFETIRIAEGEQPEAVIDLKGKPPGLYFVNVQKAKLLEHYFVGTQPFGGALDLSDKENGCRE